MQIATNLLAKVPEATISAQELASHLADAAPAPAQIIAITPTQLAPAWGMDCWSVECLFDDGTVRINPDWCAHTKPTLRDVQNQWLRFPALFETQPKRSTQPNDTVLILIDTSNGIVPTALVNDVRLDTHQLGTMILLLNHNAACVPVSALDPSPRLMADLLQLQECGYLHFLTHDSYDLTRPCHSLTEIELTVHGSPVVNLLRQKVTKAGYASLKSFLDNLGLWAAPVGDVLEILRTTSTL